jgi:aspartyl-tRNA(Asn)/glutamyl-tRNA(Gln) amidotransferase subunit C
MVGRWAFLEGSGEMAISRDEVLYVARLARLALTDEEVERLGEQLDAILEAVGKVSELDLTGVEPTSHPLDLANVWAEDEPRSSLPLEAAMLNAPRAEDDCFRVPPSRAPEASA